MKSEQSKNGSDRDIKFSESSISYQDDEYEVTRFIDTSVVTEELLSVTPVKHMCSESGQKIV